MRLLVFNPAGGSGKTTLARNLAHELGQQGLGLNILAIDLDPNAQLSRLCGQFAEDHSDEPFVLADLLQGKTVPTQSDHGIQILPGGIQSARLQKQLASNPSLNTALTVSLEPLMARADLTIIDVAPGFGELTAFGVRLATHVLVPFDLSTNSLHNAESISMVLKSMPIHQLGFVPMQTRGDGATARGVFLRAQNTLGVRGPIFQTVQFRQSILVAEKRNLPLRVSNDQCSNVQVFRAVAERVRLALLAGTQAPRLVPASNTALVPYAP